MKLLKVSLQFKDEIIKFKKEFSENGENIINGGELLDKIDSIEEWIKYVKKNSSKNTVSSEWVVTDTFLAFNNENILVGIISLHYELNDFLKNFGQIGYSIRPLQRKKGYAKKMLKETLKIAKIKGLDHVIISTKEDNIPSIKTIEKNGGYLIKSIEYLDYIIKMYRIDL